MLSEVHKKCLKVRDRLYPVEIWPGRIFRDAVLECAGSDRVLLEIGCGRAAHFLQRVAGEFKEAIGIDLEEAAQGGPGDSWRTLLGDAHELPLPDQSVDVVACGDVAEHLEDPVAVFREIRRVLKPGGCAIIMTVNKWFPPVLASRLLPHRLCQWVNKIATGTAEEDTFPTFYRANTPRELERCALEVDLVTDTTQYLSHHPRYFMFSVLAYRAAVVIERLKRRYGLLAPLRHMILFRCVRPHASDRPGQHSAVGEPGHLEAVC